MTVACPHCAHSITLQSPRPGKFSPACPLCKQKFSLTIPQEGQGAPLAAKPAAVTETVPPSRAKELAATRADADDAMADLARPARVESNMPETLGGYRLVKRLGQGGMGSVYLARQLSLDRDVALKLLAPELAHDPEFVSRFTREAYAAAQLTHHNVVQIHDIGLHERHHFFSMEFVDGASLANLVKKKGKLDPKDAAAHVLQAARGLKYAHDHGLVHRDVKPDNLLVNADGLVKVADLGLVKSAGERSLTNAKAGDGAGPAATQAGATFGTPAYMAPEQFSDATKVDARADVYSLGCTFYDLLTGRPPFSGRTVPELRTQHATVEPTPPDVLVKEVPKPLTQILLKMVAKRPADRYQSMDEVILALEGYLGVDSTSTGVERQRAVQTLEGAVEAYHAAPAAKLRTPLIVGFYALCTVVAALAAADRSFLWAACFVLLPVLTSGSYVLLTGVTQRTHFFRKVRQAALAAGVKAWLKAIGLIAVGALFLHFLSLLLPTVVVLAAGFGLATAFHFSVDLVRAKQRRAAVEQVHELLKSLRVRGLSEDSIREFMWKFSGPRWEEPYEQLFGYDAKVNARAQVREAGLKGRKRYAAWRDPILRRIEEGLRRKQERRDRQLLQKVEADRLRAMGEQDAARKARHAAEYLQHKASELKERVQREQETVAPGRMPAAKIDWARVEASREQIQRESLPDHERQSYAQRRYGGLTGLLVGPQARFLLGALLLLGFAMWVHQNHLLNANRALKAANQTLDQARSALGDATRYDAGKPQVAGILSTDTTGTKPLDVPLVPAAVTNLFADYRPLLAGALLVLSAMLSSTRLGLFLVPGAALMLTAHLLPLPQIGALTRPMVAAVIGLGVMAVGMAVARNAD